MTEAHRPRRGRWLVLLLLVVVAAVLALVATCDGAREPVSEPRSPEITEGSPASPAEVGADGGEPTTDEPPLAAPPRRRTHVQRPPTGASSTPAESPPAGTVQVLVVRDEVGRAVADATVSERDGGWEGRTPANGTLGLPLAVAAGTVDVTAAGFADGSATGQAGAPMIVVLTGTGRVVGNVREEDGTGVAGVRVTATCSLSDPSGSTSSVRDTETGADGEFVIEGLPPGDAVLRAEAPGTTGFPLRTAELGYRLPSDDRAVLVLERSRDIRGRVTDPSGNLPPGKLSVVMRGVLPSGGNGAVWSGSVEPDGSFVVPDVGSGTNVLWAWTSDRDSQLALTILRDVRPGTDGLTIALETGGSISGRLVDDSGEVMTTGGWLYAHDADGLVNSAALRADGGFQTHLLPRDRRYDITLVSNDGWSGVARQAAAGTSDLVVVAKRIPELTGQVRLPDGSAAGAGIEVRAVARGLGVIDRPGAAVRTVTDAAGRFAFSGLADFDFTVVASNHGGGHAPARAPGTHWPGSDVTLALRDGASLAARLVSEGGRPVSGQTIWIVPEDPAFWGWKQKTDEDGRFGMSTLPHGRVRLVLDTLDGEVDLGSVDVPARDLQLTVPGR